METMMSKDAIILIFTGVIQFGWIAVVSILSKRVGEIHRDVRELAMKVSHIEGEWEARKKEG